MGFDVSSAERNMKRALRGAVLAQRDALSPVLAHALGQGIQRRALTLPVYVAARAVALYSPLGNEVETSGIFRDALDARKRLYYPKVTGAVPAVCRVRSGTDLVPGRYGILEPKGDERLPRSGENGLAVFVPGVAFDLRGNRIGRGAGWYDRWMQGLHVCVPRIALAYEFQLLEEVPVERGDLPVHTIVTESRVIACDGSEHRRAESDV